MIHHCKVCLVLIILLAACPFNAICETYTHTIDFNANQAITYNHVWKHVLSQIPQGHKIQSAQISLRVKVWYWGWNIYEQNIDIMASDTTSFALPQDRVCELNPTTNPSSSNFYTVTCNLPSEALDFIANDHEIYFGTNTYGGTYYLDYTTLTVNTTQTCDTTPALFTFTDQTRVGLSQSITSNTIIVSEITCASSISIIGGTYSINGGSYTSSSGLVSNGNTVTVRQTSSGSYSTTTNATLTIGGISGTFSVTTQTEKLLGLPWLPLILEN